MKSVRDENPDGFLEDFEADRHMRFQLAIKVDRSRSAGRDRQRFCRERTHVVPLPMGSPPQRRQQPEQPPVIYLETVKIQHAVRGGGLGMHGHAATIEPSIAHRDLQRLQFFSSPVMFHVGSEQTRVGKQACRNNAVAQFPPAFLCFLGQGRCEVGAETNAGNIEERKLVRLSQIDSDTLTLGDDVDRSARSSGIPIVLAKSLAVPRGSTPSGSPV